jgi:hypothetical protein
VTNECFNNTALVNVTFMWEQVFPPAVNASSTPAPSNSTAAVSLFAVNAPSGTATSLIVGGFTVNYSDMATDNLGTISDRYAMSIAPLRLLVNRTYVFQVTMRGDIVGNASSGSISSTMMVAARVVSSELVARIAGGDRSVWASSAAPATILSAFTSFDPDAGSDAISSGPLLFVWTCRYALSQVACPTRPLGSTATSAPLLLTDEYLSVPTLTVPAWLLTLSNDPVQFRVSIFKDSRSASSQLVQLVPIAVALPSVDIAILVPTQGGSSWVKISSADQVSLAANLTSVSPTPIAYTLEWRYISHNIDMTSTSRALLTSVFNSQNLVIAAGHLRSGANYKFSLLVRSVDNPSQVASANVTFSVTRDPHSGRYTFTF